MENEDLVNIMIKCNKEDLAELTDILNTCGLVKFKAIVLSTDDVPNLEEKIKELKFYMENDEDGEEVSN
ncbi:MAG: hypothetical protein GTN36_02785 [Candidatus Aenigmarchaeota archaeon]|nr:hypothetical protein [Candidatus Aenigmarchaeota archaeon]